MGFTQDLFSSRRNFTDGNTRVGQTDRIWYDNNTNTLRIGDGNPGGKIIAGTPYLTTPLSTYYGSFYDLTSTAVSNVAIAHTVSISATFNSYGVTVVNNEMIVPVDGTYQVTFSIQFINTGNTEHDIDVWFQLNEVNIPYSNSQFTIDAKSGNKAGKLIAVTPFTTPLLPTDRLRIMWNCQSSDVNVITLNGRTVPPEIPVTPGIIVLIKKI